MSGVPDPVLAVFMEQVYAHRRPAASFTGPQEAVITTVSGSGAGTSCYFTVPAYSTTFKFGPSPCPAGATAGQRALAVFVGSGAGDPWIVAVTTVAKPTGF